MGTVHNNAVRVTQQAQTKFDSDLSAIQAASQKVQTLSLRKAKVDVVVADLEAKAKAHPKKYAAALAAEKKKQAALGKDLDGAIATLEQASSAVKTDGAALTKAKEAALAAAKQEGVPAAYFVDSVSDAGSLSAAKQKELLGASSGISASDARARDVKTVKESVARLPPEEAIKVLDRTLMGTDKSQQADLLAQLKPELEKLAGAVVGPHREGATAPADAYLEAMKLASPDARKAMAAAIATAMPAGKDWTPGRSHVGQTGLGAALLDNVKRGAHIHTAAEITAALMSAGKADQASGVRSIVAERARDVRQVFESKEKTVNRLRGELALLNQGVGSMMTDDQRLKAIAAFKKEHAEEFAAFDKAAADYAEVLKAFTRDSGPPQEGNWAYTDNKFFDGEMAAAAKHFPSIASTPAGEAALIDALSKQADGVGPAWLTELATAASTTKSLTEGTANVIAMGIAHLAAKGSLTSAHDLSNVLQSNAKLLGIEQKAIDKITAAFTDLDGSQASVDKVKKAFTEIEGGGQFGQSEIAKHSLKIIGLGLSAYGFANGLKGWSDADAKAKIRTVVDAANLGVDGSKYALELLGKEGVAKTLSRFGSGGLAVVGGILDGINAYDSFKEGNIGAGVGSSLSAAGGLLMGAASISEAIPGGQLIGAGLALAGLVTNLVVGSREKAKQERASEKDAMAYLVGGGVDPAVAKPLSNVREADHRNAGVPMRQVAEKLGMNPNELFKKIQSLPPAKVDAFVKTMLNLELGDDGRAKTGPLRPEPDLYDSPVVRKDMYFIGTSDTLHTRRQLPRSVATAAEWTRQFLSENGL